MLSNCNLVCATDTLNQEIRQGDRVGVGAQVWACLKCPQCKASNENYCPHMSVTYSSLQDVLSQLQSVLV